MEAIANITPKELKLEVTLKDLFNSKHALNELNSITFKALHGYKVKKIVSAVNAEMTIFEDELKEKRDVLFKDIPEGENPTDEQTLIFNDEINELLDTMVTLKVDHVKLSWFAKSNGVINDDTEWHDFKPSHFQSLAWLINCDID